MMISRYNTIRLGFVLLLGTAVQVACTSQASKPRGDFDAQRAYQDVVTQVGFGPRYPASRGHAELRLWLVESLNDAGWEPVVLEGTYREQQIYNIQACRGWEPGGQAGYILIGAHYDTRRFADNDPDPDQRTQPVPGAEDGASGVAVLLELARVLPLELPGGVCLVFFDAEDGGRIDGWEWGVGSQIYADQMTVFPEAVVIVDMVGDQEQRFPMEGNSDPILVAEIWQAAAELGIDSFVSEPGPHMLDDHTAFIQMGIPAVDIIDFDYPFWHTVSDTADKVSPQSLKNVGDVLLRWLLAE